MARAEGNAPTVPSTEREGSELFPALPPGDPIVLPLSDFSARAAWDRGHYVARLAIACCAADAFPVKFKLLGKELSDLPDDSWIEVDATLRPGSAMRANDYVPAATVHSVRHIAQPEDPYER